METMANRHDKLTGSHNKLRHEIRELANWIVRGLADNAPTSPAYILKHLDELVPPLCLRCKGVGQVTDPQKVKELCEVLEGSGDCFGIDYSSQTRMTCPECEGTGERLR